MNSSERLAAEHCRKASARAGASSRDRVADVTLARNCRMRALLGIGPPKIEELKAAREIVSDVGGLAIEKGLELLIGFANAGPDDVLLVLARELTARDKKIGTVLANRRARPVAEATEPDEEILLELGRFLLAQLVVRDERDVDETERLLKDCLDFSLENVFRGGVASRSSEISIALSPMSLGMVERLYPFDRKHKSLSRQFSEIG